MSQRSATAPAERMWSWVDHLRGGGTTTWQDWSGPSRRSGLSRRSGRVASDGAAPPLAFQPGAHQLELLRRVNLAETGPTPYGLGDRVLQASAHGRGGDGLSLLGAPARPFGPPPIDPGQLPAEELLRVAVLLVADLIAERAEQTEPPEDADPEDGGARTPRRGLVRRVRRGYRLVGDPWVSGRLRDELRGRDRPPGGRRPRILVVAGPVDQLLADTWTHRVLTAGAPAWSDWLGRLVGHSLPPGAAPAQHAAAWAERVGRDRVLVVTDPRRVARLVGVRRLAPAPVLAHESVELARQVRSALAVVAPPPQHSPLLAEQLLAWMLPHQRGSAPVPPPEHERWVRRRAERQRRQVLEAGYAVAGDVDALVPGGHGGAGLAADGGSEADRVLALAARMLAQSTTEDPDQGFLGTDQRGDRRA